MLSVRRPPPRDTRRVRSNQGVFIHTSLVTRYSLLVTLYPCAFAFGENKNARVFTFLNGFGIPFTYGVR